MFLSNSPRIMNKKIFFTSVGLLLSAETLLFNESASAAFIRPDTATASSHFTNYGSYEPENTINGSGIGSDFDQNDRHGSYRNGTHWSSAWRRDVTNEFIDWGFYNSQTLDTIYIWNHDAYDVSLFDLTLFDDSDNVLLSLNDLQLAENTYNAQIFSFGGPISNVSRIRFDVEAAHTTAGYTGLAEVGFNTATAVPEPLTLLGAGTAIAFGTSFKRKLAKSKKK